MEFLTAIITAHRKKKLIYHFNAAAVVTFAAVSRMREISFSIIKRSEWERKKQVFAQFADEI